MIRIDRAGVAAPEALIAPNGKGERERAENALRAQRQRFADMKFTAYKERSVMSALGALFHGKCAYCESPYAAQQPGDVEHYRPKSAVAVRAVGEKTTYKPGYYWLAADWDNLLPSCADCNRPRQHEIIEGAGKRVMGKANWFPVEPEAQRATQPAAVANEPRLLLDPCRDRPEDHLVFDEDGTIAPRRVGSGTSAMGRATIEYCALARLALTQERHKRGLEVRYAIDNLLRAEDAGNSEEALRHVAQLGRMIAPYAPYSAYAASLIRSRLGALLD